MIIISMGGGLGNQMFQYAFYYKLCMLYPNQIIKLDTNYAFPFAHNGIEIKKIFNLEYQEALLTEVNKLSSIEIQGIQRYFIINIWRKFLNKFRLGKRNFLRQRDFTIYDPRYLDLKYNESYYIYGGFCNAEYFVDLEEEIKEVYQFPEIEEEDRKWLKIIKNNHCVSMHIRRGDYLKMDMGILSQEYYQKALKYIEEKSERRNLLCLLFTDDIKFVENNFKWLDNYIIVDGHSGAKSYRDMQLMSLCRYNVIANSTFSFWAAFLNKNKDKIVVAPKEPVKRCKFPFAMKEWYLI